MDELTEAMAKVMPDKFRGVSTHHIANMPSASASPARNPSDMSRICQDSTCGRTAAHFAQVSALEAQLTQTRTELAESQRTAAARLEELRRCLFAPLYSVSTPWQPSTPQYACPQPWYWLHSPVCNVPR